MPPLGRQILFRPDFGTARYFRRSVGDSSGSGRGIHVSRGPVRNSGRGHAGKTPRAPVFDCFRSPREIPGIFLRAGSARRGNAALHELQVGDRAHVAKSRQREFHARSFRRTHQPSSDRHGHRSFALCQLCAVPLARWKAEEIAGGHKLFLLDGASRSWELGYSEEMERGAAKFPG